MSPIRQNQIKYIRFLETLTSCLKVVGENTLENYRDCPT